MALALSINILELAPLADSAAEYIRQSKAENTRRAYRSDWQDFTDWCVAQNFTPPLPAAPGTVALYIAALADAGRKVATIGRRLAAISKAHQVAGHDSPCSMRHAVVSEVWKGIRRAKGCAQRAAVPVLTPDIRSMVRRLPEGLLGIRDRALLLLGFAGAFRRSELTGLDVEDLEFTNDGLVVKLRRSKTDQDGEGRKVGIPYGSNPDTCPVRSLQRWLEAADITTGPLFRAVAHGKAQPERLTPQVVALRVKRYAGLIGRDSSRYSGHSLRSGLATAAAISGASERCIMAQTGHKSAAMVRRYIRDGSLFRENAAATVGL